MACPQKDCKRGTPTRRLSKIAPTQPRSSCDVDNSHRMLERNLRPTSGSAQLNVHLDFSSLCAPAGLTCPLFAAGRFSGRHQNTSTRFPVASRTKIAGSAFSQHADDIIECCALRSFSRYSPESGHGREQRLGPLVTTQARGRVPAHKQSHRR